MKQHLKAAVERFKKSKGKEEYLISPISEIDAEIAVELIEAMKKLGRTDLVSILGFWKYNKDGDVRDALLQWNIDNNKLGGVDEEDSDKNNQYIPPRNFMRFKDEVFELAYIYRYNKIDAWDYDSQEEKFGIVLNETSPDVTKIPLYGNTKLFFEDKETRDKEYDKLHYFLAGLDNIMMYE